MRCVWSESLLVFVSSASFTLSFWCRLLILSRTPKTHWISRNWKWNRGWTVQQINISSWKIYPVPRPGGTFAPAALENEDRCDVLLWGHSSIAFAGHRFSFVDVKNIERSYNIFTLTLLLIFFVLSVSTFLFSFCIRSVSVWPVAGVNIRATRHNQEEVGIKETPLNKWNWPEPCFEFNL